tara:strand:- start:329 stop:586 length:258 start_codon:yes stop_codon:yes gene_type:complete
MTPRQLKKFILAEATSLSETLEQGKDDPENVDADEVDADKLAKTLEKDVDFMKALKIKESRLKKKLAKIDEAKRALRSRIMRRLV